MTKVNTQNWAQLDFLINNFYEIVEYKRGRGIYGDRVVMKRSKRPECIVGEPDKLYEFYYMDANAVKELPMTVRLKVENILHFVVNPESMNIMCSFKPNKGLEPSEWALNTKAKLSECGLDFNRLNDCLIDNYKLLNTDFLMMLKKHRERQYFLASSAEYNFITKEYANEQLARL